MAKIYWFLGHEQFQPEVLVTHAKLAEEVGFDGVMVSEHFHPWVEDSSASGFGFATLGAIAQATNHIELMTAVTTPLFRFHPAVIAQASATIDRLSNGRFSLGVGTGENINEGALGYTYPDYPERAERMREALTIMSALLSGRKLTYKGKYYQTQSARLYSPPLHTLPIFLAAGGKKSAQLAGEMADGVIVSVKDVNDTLLHVTDPARDKAESKPKFEVVANRWTVFAKDEEEAWKALGPWRGLRAPSRAKAFDPKTLQDEADLLPRQEILDKYKIISNISDYEALYAPLITNLGAGIIGIQSTSLNQEKLIHEIGLNIVPKLKSL